MNQKVLFEFIIVRTVNRCSTSWVGAYPLDSMTPQELVIQHAVQEVLGEICTRLGRAFILAYDIEAQSDADKETALTGIQKEVRELMDWLDWTSIWVKCRPACDWDEMCTVPTWSFLYENRDNMTPRCAKRPGIIRAIREM